jgi:predicted nucleic acid-binding Zn ribbon protein
MKTPHSADVANDCVDARSWIALYLAIVGYAEVNDAIAIIMSNNDHTIKKALERVWKYREKRKREAERKYLPIITDEEETKNDHRTCVLCSTKVGMDQRYVNSMCIRCYNRLWASKIREKKQKQEEAKIKAREMRQEKNIMARTCMECLMEVQYEQFFIKNMCQKCYKKIKAIEARRNKKAAKEGAAYEI